LGLPAPVLEQTHRYPFPSSLVGDGDRRRLRFATSGDPTPNPRFFRGRLLLPVVAADLLLTLGDVARSRFHMPAQMLKRILRVDDGTRSSLLTVDDLGSEQIYAGDPPIPGAEMRLRASATQLIEDLRSMGDREPWTPPALLVWWRPELPADANAETVRWPTAAIDFEAAGHSVEHPVWERCVRLDGDQAAELARLARSLPIDHLVEQGGGRYGLVLRPIHDDEIDEVDCP
jgi:hypothetical protein